MTSPSGRAVPGVKLQRELADRQLSNSPLSTNTFTSLDWAVSHFPPSRHLYLFNASLLSVQVTENMTETLNSYN